MSVVGYKQVFTIRAHMEITDAEELCRLLTTSNIEFLSEISNYECSKWYVAIRRILRMLWRNSPRYRIAIHKDSECRLSDMEQGFGCFHVMYEDQYCILKKKWLISSSSRIRKLIRLTKNTAFLLDVVRDKEEMDMLRSGTSIPI